MLINRACPYYPAWKAKGLDCQCDDCRALREKTVCPDCEQPLDEDGDGVVCCFYSRAKCEMCGGSVCDQSC